MLATTLAAAALYAGVFAKPNAIVPQVSKADASAEAQKQFDYTLEARLAELARVDRVAERLLIANADLCPETRGRAGLRTTTLAGAKGPAREAFIRRWGDTDGVVVSSVAAGSAAAAAGLAPGDQITGLEGQPVGAGRSGFDKWGKAWKAVLDSKPASVRLQVNRGGEVRDVTVNPVRGCAYDVVLDQDSNQLNAYADGKSITITRAIVRLAETDDELALVIGHELAHNARHHMSAKRRNQTIGLLGGLALDVAVVAAGGSAPNGDASFTKLGGEIGAGMYSPEFEAEADYVGMYFLARAGFRGEGVETFWRKMAAEDPSAILAKSSHPPTTQRYLAIAATRDEIAKKQASGAALTPN
jgi:hypothetical protein